MKFEHPSAFSFGKTKKGGIEKSDSQFTPGPGEYAPVSTLKAQPKWKIGSEVRAKTFRQDIPGPGQYNTTNYSLPQNPSYSIATKANCMSLVKSNSTPGPCTYNPKMHNSSAKFTIRIKPSFSKVDINPGPGEYNLRTDKDLTFPSYRFGNEKKEGLISNDKRNSPGPGEYNSTSALSNRTNPLFSFGKELRVKGNNSMNQSPGPGDYLYKEYIGKEAPKITISSRFNRHFSESNLLPGPGQYNTTSCSILSKAPSYRIGTASRDPLKKFKESNPGPGQYVPDKCTNATRAKTPSWLIGTSQRMPLNPSEPSFPGVGNYNIANSIGLGTKVTIAAKHNSDRNFRDQIPGPGQYNTNSSVNLINHPSWKIGLSSRDDIIKKAIKDNVPGPGLYTLNNNKDQKHRHRFGTERRYNTKHDNYPGPGQYRIPCAVIDVNNYTRISGKFNPEYHYV